MSDEPQSPRVAGQAPRRPYASPKIQVVQMAMQRDTLVVSDLGNCSVHIHDTAAPNCI